MAAETNKEAFLKDVEKGLSSKPKCLNSKYFYNERGDKIFQEIMKMEEYYLTNCEYEILQNNIESIINHLGDTEESLIQLVELGAGSGFKTKLIIDHMVESKAPFEYLPIDISIDVLKELKDELLKLWPSLQINPLHATYFEGLSAISKSGKSKLVLFLGSNIGNFEKDEVFDFLKNLYDSLSEGDFLLLGVDLKKDPNIILEAYNDSKGITRAFNLNLLDRINKELNGEFDLTQFQHFPTYDPLDGITKSFLISRKNQDVYIGDLNTTIHFDYAEPIQMEVSNKYDLNEIELILYKVGFKSVENYFDCKRWYLNSLIRK